jgi:uncharacterized repeat protein (TIGR01451 family)
MGGTAVLRLSPPWLRLILGLCLPLVAGRLNGQQEVIATAEPVSPAPASRTAVPAETPAQGTIQPVSFTGDPPAPSGSTPPMLPPSALLESTPRNAAAAPATNAADARVAAVFVEVVAPERIILGQPLTQQIIVHNNGTRPIAKLRIEQPLPVGARPLSCDPPAICDDRRLTWDLRNLEAGGQRCFKIELRPAADGVLDLRPYVTVLPSNGARTQVVRPPFSIEMIVNRESVSRNDRVLFSIRVANHGDAPVNHVKLYDRLPPGLHHPRGPNIEANLGDLLPGQSRTVTLDTRAVQTGVFHNEVRAQADGGVEAQASVDVTITEPKLSLRLDGPKQSVSQGDVDFRLEAVNPGPLTAKNVRLVQALPPTFEVASASAGAYLDTNQHALVWSLPDLPAGKRQTVTFRGKVNAAGDWPLTASLLSQNVAEARKQHTLHVEAAPLLHLEVKVQQERLAVNEESVYRMHVFNKGEAPCSGVRLTATMPDAVTAFDAQDGPTVGQIDGHQVRFAPLEQLPAQAHVVYRIRVRGRAPGKGSVRVELTADKQAPIQREMSIQVQGDAPASTAASTNSAEGETLR